MGTDRVVIGTGPSALRAAAVLATAGHRVTLLQTGPTPSGLRHPDVPIGTGRMRVRPEHRALVEAALGPLVDAPDPDRAILSDTRVFPLPLPPWRVPDLFPNGPARRAAARAWTAARIANAFSDMAGGRPEERSYRDWVARRLGLPAYHHVYRPYAERRFGLPGPELAASIARVFHGRPDPGPHPVPGGGPAVALEHAVQVVAGAGGSIVTSANVRALRTEAGRVRAVVLDGGNAGEVPVDGPLWAAAPPARIAEWIGEALPAEAARDCNRLATRKGLQVALRGPVEKLPQELHVVEETAPFFRIVRPYGLEEVAVVHASRPEDDVEPSDTLVIDRFVTALLEMGLGRFSPDGGRVEWLPFHYPLWDATSHVRLRRVLLAWRALGVVGVGRSGAFAPLDPGEEIALAAAYRDETDPDQREVHRRQVDPPVKQDDTDVRITRFVER